MEQRTQIKNDETLLSNYVQLNSKILLSWFKNDRFNKEIWFRYLKFYLNIYKFVNYEKKFFLLVKYIIFLLNYNRKSL